MIQKEILLPTQLAAQRDSLGWARDRSTLWNAAEHAEARRDSRVAREFIVALPHELLPAKRAQLAMQFAQAIADRYRSAVDVAIHEPRGDARNFHAHLLTTTREVTVDGLGRKTTLELSGTQRHELGLPRWRDEVARLRKDWADLTNGALERAHVATRVTHLTRAERGLAISDASPRVPLAAYHMEQRGERSFIAEKIRERHRAALERVKTEPDRRTLTTIGQSIVRELGAGVTSAWRGLQERFGLELKVAAAIARGPERSQQLAGNAERGGEAIERSAPIDKEAQAARNWLAYREQHQAERIDAAQAARNWIAYRQEQQQELEPKENREHSRNFGGDFSL